MIKNILLLTPIYPAEDIPKTFTPVVHYFAKEWVKLGYNVTVIHFVVNFPKWINTLCKPFSKKIASIIGIPIRTDQLEEKLYRIENVTVYRIPLKKLRPHSRYRKKEIDNAFQKSKEFLNRINFIPDCIIGHWVNPQIEIIEKLKSIYDAPSTLVLHDNGKDFKTIYRKDAERLFASIDLIGFRSIPLRKEFERTFKLNKNYFNCFSGIPSELITPTPSRDFSSIKNFLFVGTLYKRKYPSTIITAVNTVFKNNDYRITFIGAGEEYEKIKTYAKKLHKEQQILLLGRKARTEVSEQMLKHDVFIMISKNEAFGLVYLEAMASGCITIASRNEGFDGIIIDGENGFLCEAGNSQELSQVIEKIRSLTASELQRISQNAIITAQSMTDTIVAKNYINTIQKYKGIK